MRQSRSPMGCIGAVERRSKADTTRDCLTVLQVCFCADSAVTLRWMRRCVVLASTREGLTDATLPPSAQVISPQVKCLAGEAAKYRELLLKPEWSSRAEDHGFDVHTRNECRVAWLQ